MSWLSDFLDWLSSVPLPATLLFSAAFAAAESGLGIGIAVPGETVVLVLAASMDSVSSLIGLFVTVTLASSAGDHIGYLLGRRYGERLRDLRLLRKIGEERWDRATRAFGRYGAWSVFLTRPLPIVRTLTPAAAGISNVHYRRFLPASLAGAVLWSTLYVVAGAVARASIDEIESLLSQVGLAVLAGVAVVIGAIVLFRRRRGARSSES